MGGPRSPVERFGRGREGTMSRKASIALAALLFVGIEACNAPAATLGPANAPATPSATAIATPVITPKPDTKLTRAQQNAIQSAKDYLAYSAFSRSGLIDQLVFEGYSKADATFATDSLHVDWNEQAFLSAQAYLDYSSFSLSGLIEQLKYEGFSKAQAEYGAKKAYK
jgi:host cell surface-exposed lipoprotein